MGTVLETCEELLRSLYRHEDHAKLRRLIADIEELRDRLKTEAKADSQPADDATGE